MGNTKTPKFRIEMTCIHFLNKRKETHSIIYSVKENGTPSKTNAWKFRNELNNSMLRGVNTHLSKIHSLYSDASIVNQKTCETVAVYKSNSFEVIG